MQRTGVTMMRLGECPDEGHDRLVWHDVAGSCGSPRGMAGKGAATREFD